MSRIIPISFFLFFLTHSLSAQVIPEEQKFYFTTGNDIIFSLASVEYGGQEQGTVLRWAPLFNPHVYYHYDLHNNIGYFGGVSLQNVGFIMDMPDATDTRKKFRSYNLGIPVGVKFGELDRSFLYAGFSLEFPVNYKEKTFIDGKKEDKLVVWFGDRVQPVQGALFAGYRMPINISLYFKYYLTGFFNRSFTTVQNNAPFQPYRDFKAHVFYFGLSFDLFRNTKFVYRESFDRIL